MTRRTLTGAVVATVFASAMMSVLPPVAAHAMPARSLSTSAGCAVRSDSTLVALYDRGQNFSDFLAAAKARREGWRRIADSAQVGDALLARAKAVGGTWRLLVVAIDACGDSMNSVPYLAKLAEKVPGLDLRIVLPAAGRAVQDSHRSLDGRRATPTLVLLDDAGRDMGCIVELPREIRDWGHRMRPSISSDSLHAGIRAFYASNRGVGITTEAVELLEAAKAGSPLCQRGTN